MPRNRAAYTLVEILVTITIVAIAAVAFGYRLGGVPSRVEAATIIQQKEIIQTALDQWVATAESVGAAFEMFNPASPGPHGEVYPKDTDALWLHIKPWIADASLSQAGLTSHGHLGIQSALMRKSSPMYYVQFVWNSDYTEHEPKAVLLEVK